MTDIVTHDTCDYKDRPCKCYLCGRVEVATFKFDYYVLAEHASQPGPHPLVCERCLLKRAFGDANPPMKMIVENPDGSFEEIDPSEQA